MSNRKKFFLIFIFIILDIFLLIGFLIIRDKTLENTLKNEINSLKELDITKDRYNIKIKTRGNYAIIEKAIKDYLDEYAVNLQSVLGILNDEEFTGLLLADNYTDDPEFKDEFAFIEKTRDRFNKKISELIDECDKDNIKNYIRTKMVDPYYIALYEELMIDDNVSRDIIESRELLGRTKERVNLILDTCDDIFNFLKNHNGEWVVENSEVKFKTQALLDQYNAYLKNIQ